MISKIPDRKYQKPLLLMTTKTSLISLALISTSWAALAQTTFHGNGNTGFGGTFGNGSLKLSDDGTTLFGTLTAANTFNNPFVLYIDSTTGGFSHRNAPAASAWFNLSMRMVLWAAVPRNASRSLAFPT